MSIDTRNKRFSLMGLGAPLRPRVFPNPDASFANQSDRQQLEYLYAGVLTSAGGITYFDGLTTRMTLTGAGR